MSIDLGDTVTLATTFTVASVLTDPTSITLLVQDPTGTQTTYTWPSPADITQDSTGTFHIDITIGATVDLLGRWDYQWTGTGAAAGVEQGTFDVGTLLTPLTSGRASMASILRRVRLLINDPAGSSQVFSDAQLQDWLDENREDVRYLELTPEWQTSGQTTQWFSFYDSVYGGHWESDAAFVSRAWSPVTPDTSDFLTGKWTWNTSQFPPIFISGRTYDVYSAAADALEAWAASVALDFDVSTGRNNLSLSRSQKHAQLLKVADQYRARGRTTSIPLIRSDT